MRRIRWGLTKLTPCSEILVSQWETLVRSSLPFVEPKGWLRCSQLVTVLSQMTPLHIVTPCFFSNLPSTPRYYSTSICAAWPPISSFSSDIWRGAPYCTITTSRSLLQHFFRRSTCKSASRWMARLIILAMWSIWSATRWSCLLILTFRSLKGNHKQHLFVGVFTW